MTRVGVVGATAKEHHVASQPDDASDDPDVDGGRDEPWSLLDMGFEIRAMTFRIEEGQGSILQPSSREPVEQPLT